MTHGEWRTGWKAILAAAGGLYVASSHVYSLGLFIKPLEAEFGWSRGDISLGVVLVAIVSTIAMPLLALVVDRIGARRLAIAGLLVFCSNLAALSAAGGSILTWWIGWACLGLSYSMISAPIWLCAAANLFERSRGLAMAATLAASGTAAATLPIIVGTMIERFGWRGAYVGLGALELAVILPMVVIFFHPGRSDGPGVEAAPIDKRAILRSRVFWTLALTAMLAGLGLIGLTVHFVPFLTGHGIDAGMAARIAGVIGLCGILGRFIGGFALDRVAARIVGVVAFGLPVAACLILIFADVTPLSATIAAVLVGLALGGEGDVIAYVAARYFGVRQFAFSFSIISAFLVAGSGLGPWLAAEVFDVTGDYAIFFMMLVALFAGAVLLLALLGPYPDETRADR